MRIVAHNGARIWGGAERATVSLLEGLAERGHEVLLLCNDPIVAQESASRGVRSRVCLIAGDFAVHHSLRLARVLRTESPDAFIVGTYKKLFLAALGARLAGVPRVVARVGLESDTPRSFKYRYSLRRWTGGVAVTARRMISPFADLDGFGPAKVTLIWNSVRNPSSTARSLGIRAELGIDDDVFVIGTVARLSRQKRLDRLLEVVSLLTDVQCIIAGDGKSRNDLEKLARSLGVADRVHFLGNRDDVSDVMDALDVFVITSDSEGMSNSMLEAMSRGRPVISTDVSGARDALDATDEYEAAGLITGFDPRSIATAIQSLQRDAALREALGRSARQRAVHQFSRDAMLTAWEEFLTPAAHG